MKCKYCGRIIDDNATVCPVCGCQIDKDDGYYFEAVDSSDKWLISGAFETGVNLNTPLTEYPNMIPEGDSVPKTENLEEEDILKKSDSANKVQDFEAYPAAPLVTPSAYNASPPPRPDGEAIKRREARLARKKRESIKLKIIIAGAAAIVVIAFLTFWLASGRNGGKSPDGDSNIIDGSPSDTGDNQVISVVQLSETVEFPGTVKIININGRESNVDDVDKSMLVRIINSQHYIRLRDLWNEYYMFDQSDENGDKYGQYTYDTENEIPEYAQLDAQIPNSDKRVYRYIDVKERKMYTDKEHSSPIDLSGICIVNNNGTMMIYVQIQQYCEADREAKLSFNYEADKPEIIIK